MKLQCAAAVLALSAAAAFTVSAAEYPARPIHMSVPFATGGPTDLIARIVATQMEPALKQPVLIENRPGGSGLIGVMVVARAEPNGYNLVSTGGAALGPTFIKSSNIELYRDLQPISAIYEGTFGLVMQRSVPANSVAELVAYAKANPGKLNYGSIAQNETMIMAMFMHAADIDVVEIPYKGQGPRTTAIMANEVQLLVGSFESLKRPDLAAKVRPVLIFGNKPAPSFPDVQTAAQAGYPNLVVTNNGGMWAPQGTPMDIVNRLNKVVVGVLAEPAVRTRIRDVSGFDAGGTTPEELRARNKAERDFFVQAAGIIKLQPQ